MQTQDSNRRHAPRHNVRLRVVWDDSVNFNCAATLNLSATGALLTSDVPIPMGTHVSLIPLPNDDMDDISLMEIRGEVVRAYEDILVSAYADNRFHMGIRLDLDEADQIVLDEYLSTHLN